MKKRIVSIVISLILVMGIESAVFARTMYAPDGRTAEVEESQVEAWRAVGWYPYSVIIMKSLDGRWANVNVLNYQEWARVGWYSDYYPYTSLPTYTLFTKVLPDYVSTTGYVYENSTVDEYINYLENIGAYGFEIFDYEYDTLDSGDLVHITTLLSNDQKITVSFNLDNNKLYVLP